MREYEGGIKLSKDWNRVISHAKELIEICEGVQVIEKGVIDIEARLLIRRYEQGERTEELYNELLYLG